MHLTLEQIREDFPVTKQGIYLNHAAVGPLPLSVQKGMQERMQIRATNPAAAWDLGIQRYDEGRELAAELVNGVANRIAYIQNTSHGISLLAQGINWKAGDNVIIPDREFPSNVLVWESLRKRGVEIRRAQSVDGRLLPDHIHKLLDARTRVVTLSQVQYYNGYRVNLEKIGEICRHSNTYFFVDGTQSIGAINADVEKSHIDALVVSAHKWMLGPIGIGFMALSERVMAEIEVAVLGWLSIEEPFDFDKEPVLLENAGKFEPGSENGVGMYGLVERLRTIKQLGPQQIENRIIHLTDYLCAELSARNFTIESPRDAEHKSGIVTFAHPEINSKLLLKKLEESNIQASLRNGNIRVSPHYYNSEDEIDAVLHALTTKL